MARGKLRVYLGAAPGVGKTYAMLNEGCRAHERGRDVVVAYLETHGRPNTEAQCRDLEVVARKRTTYRDQVFQEMDVDAVLARAPSLALVDELAHTNVPGSRHAKRWQDVEELLDAGINVISTVNIQHLESLNDVVGAITGIQQRETLPDGVVRRADQIELVDMSPESLRRRMAHGNIYRPERVEAALGNYFRVGNLTALRELALLWVADRVDEGLQEYRARHGIADPWETKERVVVALTGATGGDRLIRRGARMAARAHAELVGVHVRNVDGVAPPAGSLLDTQRALLDELGGRFAEITGADVGRDLAAFARAENATQLLLGATHRSRWAQLFRGSVINDVIRHAGEIDVHVIGSSVTPVPSGGRQVADPEEEGAPVPDDRPASRRATQSNLLPRLPGRHRLATLSVRRRVSGWLLALVALPGLVGALTPLRSSLTPTGTLPLVLLGVVAVATVGGLAPAVVGALIGFGFADWFLVPPVHSLTINRGGDAAALVVFVVVGVTVALSMDRLARRAVQVARARAEAEALTRLVGGNLVGARLGFDPLVSELRTMFGAEAVAVLHTSDDAAAGGWTVQAGAGQHLPRQPTDGTFFAEIAPGTVLVVDSRRLDEGDRRLLGAFVEHLRLVREQEELAERAADAQSLAEANELRTALLAAVSHDLRTPLASIKACATSLLSDEVQWDPEVARSFVATIDAETDRLNRLVGNLLDMSRLQTGGLAAHLQPVGLDEVVAAALASLSGSTASVVVDVPESLPTVEADPSLLERAVANLVANALAWNRPEATVRIEAGDAPPEDLWVRGGGDGRSGAPSRRLELRIVDVGPGIPLEQREEVFRPFQRLGDGAPAGSPAGPPSGVGLGLAVSRGFVEAMKGELSLEDTPGGGLTAVIALPLSAAPGTAAAPPISGPAEREAAR